VTKLRLPVLPYLFACTFIADTASFLLPVSNPINIIITSRFPLDLLAFLRLLLLPSLANFYNCLFAEGESSNNYGLACNLFYEAGSWNSKTRT